MLAIKTILHPTDFSERSDYAFRLACALARDHGARVIVLHVAELPIPAYGEASAPVALIQISMEAEKECLERIVAPQGVKIERRLVEGAAATEILRAAEEMKADLIVLGTHGRTGINRFLLGSVAEQVVRKARCPVLSVKTPFPTTETVEPV
jgi:nucleotide-binding universal stress UspA family protein